MERSLKALIKKLVAGLLRPINHRLGITPIQVITTSQKDDLLDNFIFILKQHAYSPKLIFDVGANHGTWSRKIKSGFPDATFILVEPQAWLRSSCEDILIGNSQFLPVGAGRESGKLMFTVNKDRDDSSTFILSKDDAVNKGFQQIEVPVLSINEIVGQTGNQIPDIIKIDAEGLDLDVLQGATDTFGKTEIFLVEAAVNAPFKNTKLIDVVNFMDYHGYLMFDITDINRPFDNRILWLIELAFVKKGGHFDKADWIAK
jgi:FkbM family methyltransferase